MKELGIEFWMTLGEMAPYLLFGFLIAGVLSVFISPSLVEKHLGGEGFWPLFKASLFGVPLPLCSCGVIPVSMSLHKHGASRGATTSFLLSTPQTGIDSILVTYSLMGIQLAIFRPIAAFITGILGGSLVSLFDSNTTGHQEEQSCTSSCCSGTHSCDVPPWYLRILEHGFVTLPRDIGRALFVGIVIAALIAAIVPDDFFTPLLGGGIVAMLLMVVMGIPVYVCATASVPVALALIDKGVSPGTAMVFLMTGPATNAAALMTLWDKMGRKTALLYLFTVIIGAIGSGLVIDIIFPDLTGVIQEHIHEMGISIFGHISAVALILVLLNAMYYGKIWRQKTT